jgi:endonuclease/exonuclease/phosphatase family metal-dependent hydrolase
MDPGQAARYGQLTTLLRKQKPDILAVQELISSHRDKNIDGPATRRNEASRALLSLATALGMVCDTSFVTATAISLTRHHTGLLWRPGIDVVPHSLTRYDSHVHGNSRGLVAAVFTLGGKKVRIGSAHLSHCDPGMSGGWKDAGVVMRAFNRGDGIPGIVGGDWQGIGADADYDKDPYHGKEWDQSHSFHYDRDGNVDRDAAIRLERHGRFKDCARIAAAPWQETTGHHETDTNQPRRIDRIYVTHDVPDEAVTGFRVVDPAEVGQCTDHCPVVVEFDEAAL